jgi:pentatricopeptide repeat domain-containing protein 1
MSNLFSHSNIYNICVSLNLIKYIILLFDLYVHFKTFYKVWRKMISKHVRPSLYTYNLLLKCTRECGLGDEFETRKIIGQIIDNPNLLKIESKFEESNSNTSENNKFNTSFILNGNKNNLSIIENRPNLLDVKPYFGDIIGVSEIQTPEER